MRVLIVEDEKDFRDLIVDFLSSKGFQVEGVGDLKKALDLIDRKDFAVVILDLLLPDGNGLQLLEKVKEESPLTEVIVLTGHGTVKTAVEAMKKGAYDFLTKPCSLQELELLVEKAMEKRSLAQENLLLKKERDLKEFPVFHSPSMKEILKKLQRVSCSDCPVLIVGESGVGKEILARLIHVQSERRNKPFVAINVASIPSDLLEAELFGYEKGAFTGANRSKEGFFELSDGGTLFLDEIGEMDLQLQSKLLRAIETKRFYRVGGRKEIFSDVRIVTATNRDLKKLVEEGKFREDLYYRLNVVEIRVPPLRERPEDILPLAEHFLKVFTRKYNSKVKGFTESAKAKLLDYHWPGNVRELKNVIERAVLFAEGDLIDADVLDIDEESNSRSSNGFIPLKDLEKDYIKKVLEAVGGNKRKASEILGIPLRTLYRKIETLGLK